ncbi:cysteine-rich protamine-like [Battus philenor]|uniref:cysteine-rich protamine-like n=1 Tax=Battus philenor TaxID=42288 RepID=UPI0035D06E74
MPPCRRKRKKKRSCSRSRRGRFKRCRRCGRRSRASSPKRKCRRKISRCRRRRSRCRSHSAIFPGRSKRTREPETPQEAPKGTKDAT